MENNKRITVSEFVKGYEKLRSEDVKNKYVDKHITTTYAPILEKMSILKIMNEKSIIDEKIRYIDLTISKINFTMAILVLYTDLEPDKDKDGESLSSQSYDMLKSTGLLDIIYNSIGNDLDELISVQKNIMDTWYTANTSTEAFIASQVIKFGGLFGSLAGTSIEKLIEVLEDENKMKKIMPMIEKAFKKANK